MPPAPRPLRRSVIAGIHSVPGRPSWVVLEGDPEQILNVVPAAIAEGSRASRSHGGLLVRRHHYEAFYRASAARRAQGAAAEDPRQPPPESDDEAAAGRRTATDTPAAAELAELRRSVEEVRRTLVAVAESVRQLQQGPRSAVLTCGPASAVMKVQVPPSVSAAPSSVTPRSGSPPAPNAADGGH